MAAIVGCAEYLWGISGKMHRTAKVRNRHVTSPLVTPKSFIGNRHLSRVSERKVKQACVWVGAFETRPMPHLILISGPVAPSNPLYKGMMFLLGRHYRAKLGFH
eukprot:1368823-Amorphochlora_amoeboformis.AAC.2